MHTPEQARELWCPMVRIARREGHHEASGTAGNPETQHEIHIDTIVGGCNTDALGRTRVPASCRCIADECAMWRWAAGVDPNWERPTQPPASFMPAPLVRSAYGFCGLSGRPEIS